MPPRLLQTTVQPALGSSNVAQASLQHSSPCFERLSLGEFSRLPAMLENRSKQMTWKCIFHASWDSARDLCRKSYGATSKAPGRFWVQTLWVICRLSAFKQWAQRIKNRASQFISLALLYGKEGKSIQTPLISKIGIFLPLKPLAVAALWCIFPVLEFDFGPFLSADCFNSPRWRGSLCCTGCFKTVYFQWDSG